MFSSVFAFCSAQRLNVLIKGQAENRRGEYVSGTIFAVWASRRAGRLTTSEDDRAGAPPVAVISYTFSQSRFGSPKSAAGQSVLINNIPFTIAGVTAPGFFRYRSRCRARRVSADAHVPPAATAFESRVSGPKLLLGRNDGAPASGRNHAAGLSYRRAGVSPVGRYNGSNGSSASQSSAISAGRWRRRTRYIAASTPAAGACIDDPGDVDPGDRVCQSRQPSAVTFAPPGNGR